MYELGCAECSNGMGQFPWPDPRAALVWVQSKLREFANLGAKLAEMHRGAAFVLNEAVVRKGAGSVEAERARGSLVRIAALRMAYDAAVQRVNDMKEKLPGFGVIPIVIPLAVAAVAIALALTIKDIFGRASAEEQALKLAAEGVLTPDELRDLMNKVRGGAFGSLADTAKYAAWGIGLYFGLPFLVKMLGKGGGVKRLE